MINKQTNKQNKNQKTVFQFQRHVWKNLDEK